MKTKCCKLVMSIILLSAYQSLSASSVISTFDTDLDQWTSQATDEISWASAGGNPDGYLRFTDGSSSGSNLLAPEKFLGDWSSLNSIGQISYDHKVFDIGNNVVDNSNYRLRISGPGGIATWQGSEVTGTTDWVTIEVPLEEMSWTVALGNWQAILSDVNEFQIGIEMFNNYSGLGEICGVDNVVLVPEPTTLSLFALGTITLIKRKRRK